MKKFLLWACLVSAGLSANSQTLSVGPKAGLTISNLTNLEGLESKAGFTAGGFLVWSFIENFGVGLDALYSREGARYIFKIQDGEDVIRYKYKVNLNYLRFNVPLNYFFRTQDDAFRPKIFLGPSLAVLMSAKNKAELISDAGSNIEIEDDAVEVTDDYKGIDFGALIGAGFNYRLAEATWLNFDASYRIGATDIPKDPESGADPVHNTGFTLTAGVGFGF